MTQSQKPTLAPTASPACPALLEWVRDRRGPLHYHVDGAREVLAAAPRLPGAAVIWSPTASDRVDAVTPVAVCTDVWLDSLPPHAPGTTAPYSLARDSKTRVVHVTATNGRWVYLVDRDHDIDPALLRGAWLGGWVVRWPD